MNIAVCFLTTKPTYFYIDNLITLSKNSSLHNIDLYIYIDNNSEYEINDNRIYFNFEYLKNKFNYHHIFSDKKGLMFLTWLDMYVNHKNEYDMYLFYEDDLIFFSFDNFFDKIDFNCDVLFQDKREKIEYISDWYWISSTPYNVNLPNLYHGLLNIYGANKNVIEDLIKFIKNDNYGHHELLISSFALNSKYKINYINDYLKCLFSYYNDIKLRNNDFDFIHPVKTYNDYLNITYYKRSEINNICIIVCFYDTNPNYLEECFTSIDNAINYFKRYYDVPIELHVMDDGSTKECTIKMFYDVILNRYPYIKNWKHQANTTLATAINDLNEYTPNNALVIYIDSDDIMMPHRILVQYEIFTKYPFWGDITLCATNTTQKNEINNKLYKLEDYYSYKIYDNILDMTTNIICHPTIAYKINNIKNNNILYDDQFKCTQDFDFILNILNHKLKILLIPDTLTHWRKYPLEERPDNIRNYLYELSLIQLKYNSNKIYEYD